MKRKLYISLPISGRDLSEAKDHAEAIKHILSDCGYFGFGFEFCLISPFDVCPDQSKPYSYQMGRCVEAILECDCVYFAYGWTKSKGCNAEFQIAKIYGKEIFC